MNEGIIYGLAGPDGIRYVGQTRRPLKARYAQHARHAAQGKQWRVSRWWRTLELPPTALILEECHVDRLDARECDWIAFYRGIGIDLCNHTDGGHNQPDTETRSRMSASAKCRFEDPAQREWLGSLRRGATATPETRAKMSKTLKAVRGTPEARAKTAELSRGHTMSDSGRQRVGESTRRHMTGRKLTAEWRENIGAGNRGKKRSPETIQRMRDAQQKRRASEKGAA